MVFEFSFTKLFSVPISDGRSHSTTFSDTPVLSTSTSDASPDIEATHDLLHGTVATDALTVTRNKRDTPAHSHTPPDLESTPEKVRIIERIIPHARLRANGNVSPESESDSEYRILTSYQMERYQRRFARLSEEAEWRSYQAGLETNRLEQTVSSVSLVNSWA